MFSMRSHDVWVDAIDGWALWMDARGRAAGSIRQMRWLLRDLATTYANRSPWRLTTEDLYTWYAKPSWGSKTRHGARSTVRSFYGWACKAGRTKRNPALDLEPVTTQKSLPRPAPEDVIEAALAAADDRMRLMIALGAYAGLRDAEIAGLRWDDITGEQLAVTGKGNKRRNISMHKAVVAPLLASERERRDRGEAGVGFARTAAGSAFVFPGRFGGPISPSRVSQLLSAALGPGYSGHQLRHRFATRVLDATGDLASVQELLGHASPETTRIYSKVSTRRLSQAVNAI